MVHLEISNEEGGGERLDRFLAQRLGDLSRSRIKALIGSGHILLNDQESKASKVLREGDRITVSIPAPESSEHQPEDLPLRVLYEDEDLIVINKESGMVVHPAAGNPGGTLVNALLHHCPDLSGVGGVERPGIVHRLDKDTSGCLVAAKNDAAHHHLSEQFSSRTVHKVYLAIVQEAPPERKGQIRNRIGRDPRNRLRMALVESGGKTAVTDYQTLREGEGFTAVRCQLHTGRTHQIRVHMKSLGCPILGDPIYARPSKQVSATRLMLHAWQLGFTHPSGHRIDLVAEPPEPFGKFLPKDLCP